MLEVIVLVGMGVFLYGDSVRLPFFSDDIVHNWWVEGNSFLDLWRFSTALGHYRPLPFVMWKVSLWLTGSLHAPLLHALNVALHILNSLLVAALARRLTRGPYARLTGLIAGLLFISFPFSYQAVSWVGSACHPLVTSLVLGALLGALGAHHWPGRIFSLVLAVAACFAHETGVIVGGWLLVYELLYGAERRPGDRMARRLFWPLVYLIPGVVYALCYLSLNHTDNHMPAFTAERLIQNGSYLLQGLAFPIAPLTRWTMAAWGWTDLQAAQTAAVLSVALLSGVSWRGNGTGLRLLAFALCCFVSAVVPSWLMLSYSYVISGPRLLYLASVGAALGWAGAIRAVANLGRSKGWRILALSLTASVVAFGCQFVRAREQLHHSGGDLIWQVVETARTAPPDRPVLIVNYPAWLAPDRSVYPIGHEGVEFMPGYAYVSDLSWVNGGPRLDVMTAKFANTLRPLPGMTYGVRGPDVEWEGLAERIRVAGMVYTVHYDPRALKLVQVGRLMPPPASPAPPLATFDDRVTLAVAEATQAGGEIALRLVWQSHGPLTDAVYSVFVHLYDASGTLIAQADGYVLDGLYPFWMWRAGEWIEEARSLRPESGQLPTDYRIAVGVYDLESGRRLPALSAEGRRFENDAVPVGR